MSENIWTARQAATEILVSEIMNVAQSRENAERNGRTAFAERLGEIEAHLNEAKQVLDPEPTPTKRKRLWHAVISDQADNLVHLDIDMMEWERTSGIYKVISDVGSRLGSILASIQSHEGQWAMNIYNGRDCVATGRVCRWVTSGGSVTLTMECDQ